MRRDVLRVGLGRLAFELALGVTLLLAPTDLELAISLGLTFAMALAVFVTRARWTTARRSFIAAHIALGAGAIAAVLGPSLPMIRFPLIAGALGAAIELTHLDLVQRRRSHEGLREMRWPQSVLLRRMGSVIIASIGARAMVSLEAHAHLSSAISAALLLVALGASALLSAGFAVGPGRPHARPIDAVLFVGASALLALFPMGP